MELCYYGCETEAKFTLKNGKKCCSQFSTQCIEQRKLRSTRTKEAHDRKFLITGNKNFSKDFSIRKTEKIDSKFCAYCGEKAKFVLKNGKGCCESSTSKCPSIKVKNSLGVKKSHKEGKGYILTKKDREWWKTKPVEEVQSIRKRQGDTYSKRLKSGEIIPSFKDKKHSSESKQKQSKSAGERNNGIVKTKYFSIYSNYMKKEVKVQGTWELKFAIFLNENNIRWERSKTKHLSYKLYDEDYVHTYYPDFFLPDSRSYIEIKGYWWKSDDGRVDDKRKMEKVLEYNKDKDIIIFQKEDLENLGIKL